MGGKQTCSALQLEIDTSFFNACRQCSKGMVLEHGREGGRGLGAMGTSHCI